MLHPPKPITACSPENDIASATAPFERVLRMDPLLVVNGVLVLGSLFVSPYK